MRIILNAIKIKFYRFNERDLDLFIKRFNTNFKVIKVEIQTNIKKMDTANGD